MSRLASLLLGTVWRALDQFVPKRPDFWAFSTHFIKTDLFIENPRALFESVKDSAAIHKILFVRGTARPKEDLGGVNVTVADLHSLSGLLLLLRCKVVVCDQSVSMNYSLRWEGRRYSRVPLSFRRRVVVNLWHGIPLKKLYGTWEARVRRLNLKGHMRREFPQYAGLISSSDVDSYAMTTIFSPISYDRVWVTGLPRNDFLVAPEDRLPPYLADQVSRIRRAVGGRRLVCYAPTFRQVGNFEGAGYYPFSEEEVSALKTLLRRHNAVLGVRLHYFERHHVKDGVALTTLRDHVDDDVIIDVGHSVVADMASLVRCADVVVTDYSSVFIEAMYVRKPVVCFAYDYESYRDQQEGVLYDLDFVFPGPIAATFDDLLGALDRVLAGDDAAAHDRYEWCRAFFYRHADGNNAARVAERILAALGPEEAAAGERP